MGCLCCGATADVGALCRRCARDVAPCDGLIPDHVRSTVDAAGARAWLIDGFGGAHAVAAQCRIGRSHEGDLVVLASSVSREHAVIAHSGSTWTLRDLGSRNGTLVDGVRCQGRTRLQPRSLVKVGDVALWFVESVAQPPVAAVIATGGAGGVVRYQLVHAGAELCLVGGGDTAAGGALLSRPVGANAWAERQLPPLEFQLLRALCLRAQGEAAAPSAVRGCVPTKQLARDLPFQSRFANEENVRQVVRRLRSVLAEAGAGGVLAVAPGRGYYLACGVTTG
jgi:FHA domain-containing protein